MKFGTWNVRSLHRAGSQKTVARKLARCKLNLVCVQEVRWEKEGSVRAGNYNFLYVKKRKLLIGNRIFCTSQRASAVKTVEFVSGRMS